MSTLRDIHFESYRLKTASLVRTDASVLFHIYSDADAMKYRGSAPLKSTEDAYQMIDGQSEGTPGSKRRIGIQLKATNQLIGTLLLIWNSKAEECEIGFSFGKDHWGKGYGTETLNMIEEKLQTVDQIQTIKAWCIKENLASIRIFEKAGFSVMTQNNHLQSYLFAKRMMT